MRLSELECRAGLRCAVRASIDTGPVELGTVSIATAKLAAPLTISMAETTRVDVAPDAGLTLTGVELPALAVAAVETTHVAGARLQVDDDGWRIDVERIDLRVEAATDREGLLASGPVQLATLRVRDGGATVDTEVSIQPRAATVSWDGTDIVAPGVAGKLSLRGDRVAATAELTDAEALSARVDAEHDIETGVGTVAVHDATLRFDAGKLSSRLVQWQYAWDVVAGSWTADLELSWQTGADGSEYSGTMTHRADKLAGRYNDMAFAGLSTTLNVDLDSAAGMVAAPAALEVALLDVGLPLEQITTDYALDLDNQAVQVDNLSLSTLGGRIVADPFRFGMQEQRNDITLRPQSIQLPFIMNLVDFGDIELTGSISGVIPVTISDMQLTITNGQLESDPPGGVIRYRPGIELVESGTSNSPLGPGVGRARQLPVRFIDVGRRLQRGRGPAAADETVRHQSRHGRQTTGHPEPGHRQQHSTVAAQLAGDPVDRGYPGAQDRQVAGRGTTTVRKHRLSSRRGTTRVLYGHEDTTFFAGSARLSRRLHADRQGGSAEGTDRNQPEREDPA